MARGGAWLTAFAIVATSGSAAAARRVAILPADASGETSRQILRTVNEALDGLTQSVTGVDTTAGSDLKKKIRAEARACGEDPACLAKVGRRLKVEEVIAVRARSHGNGLRLTFLAVGVENRRLLRTVSVNVEAVDGIAAAVRIRLAKILGVNQADLYAGEPEPVADVDELALEPMPSLAPLPGVDELKAPPAAPPEPVAAVVVEPEAVVATVPSPAIAPASDGGSSWMWYSGLVTLGAGVVLGGVGTYFGARYLSKKNAIDVDGPLTTPQKPAVRLENQANSARTTGIVLGVAAGAVGAVGAGLLIADLVGGDVDVNVSVQPGGARASVLFTW